MKKIRVIICIAALLSTSLAFTQNEGGAFNILGSGYSTAVINDYQCLGINPANLGWRSDKYNFHASLGEAAITIYSEPLKRALVLDLFKKDKYFSDMERDEAIENFTNSKLMLDISANIAGFSFQQDLIGGFAFNIRERVMWDSKLNETAADFLFNGFNSDYFDSLVITEGDTIGWARAINRKAVADLFGDTYLKLSWYREYNFGYGRKIFGNDLLKVFGGVSFKILKGFGIFEYGYNKDGHFVAYSALNPMFQVDYTTPSPSLMEGTDMQSNGNGFGFDIGLSMAVMNKIRFSLAVTDIGKMKWDGNVYEGENGLLENIESAGMNNYNIFEEGQSIMVENTNWGTWVGAESKETKLPTLFRAGAAFIAGEKFEAGMDFQIPTNEVPGSYNKMIVGMGLRVHPIQWFRFSGGIVTGNEFGVNIPVGLTFVPFKNPLFMWEMGIALRDVTTFFSQDKPTVSMALGFLRFSFGDIPM